MDAVEIDGFLADRRAGVLALARGNDSYAVPVSFVYDADERAFYFRLGYWPDSQKRAFAEASDDATVVVTDRTDEGWKSVVARGPLAELSTSNLDATVVESVESPDVPFVTIFDRPREDVEFHVTRLSPHELSGRKQAAGMP